MAFDKRYKKRIYMNGEDVTEWFTPSGMTVSYKKIKGDNGGTFLSGDREEDILAWKAVVQLFCMPLPDSEQKKLYAKVFSADPTLRFFDPQTGDYRTIHYMATVSEQKYRGKAVGPWQTWKEREYWTGLVITAEEK